LNLGGNSLDSFHEHIGNNGDAEEQEAKEDEVGDTEQWFWKKGGSWDQHITIIRKIKYETYDKCCSTYLVQ